MDGVREYFSATERQPWAGRRDNSAFRKDVHGWGVKIRLVYYYRLPLLLQILLLPLLLFLLLGRSVVQQGGGEYQYDTRFDISGFGNSRCVPYSYVHTLH